MKDKMENIEEHKKKIDEMTHIEMARLWRFAPSGHPYFEGELYQYFKNRFDSFGGFTPAISKSIGWEK